MTKLLLILCAGAALNLVCNVPSVVLASEKKPAGNSPKLQPSNFQSMLLASCRAGSKIRDQRALGGFASSGNFPRRIDQAIHAPRKEVYLLALPREETTFGRKFQGMKVLLVNGTGQRASFSACDSTIGIIQEAKDRDGKWKPIEYVGSSFCGNSYHSVFLGPKECWQFSVPRYVGSFPTSLRFSVGFGRGKRIYSNEFKGAVNPSQFARRQERRINLPLFEKKQPLPRKVEKPTAPPEPAKAKPKKVEFPAKPEAGAAIELRNLANSWSGYTNDGALRYKLTLKRRGTSNDFAAVFTLPDYPRWKNYANRQNFKLLSIRDGMIVFERNNGHVYRAKLVEKGTKMIEGTRGNRGAGINPNFVNWELSAGAN